MDFNDLQLRLERIYTAIGDLTDWEIQKYVKITIVGDVDDPNKTAVISFDNGKSESELTNIVVVTIEHFAKLKDHLKKKLGSRDQLVEDNINKSFELQLIMDLYNAEKHGYPLQRPDRSHKSPRIQNIKTVLTIPPQEVIGINTRTREVVVQGNCHIKVLAEIVDKNGVFICSLSQLVDTAMREWEHFIRDHNLV